MDIVVAGFTAAALIGVLTEVIKRLTGRSDLAPWVALLLAVVVVGVNMLIKFVPEVQQFVEAIVAVLVLFLGTTGGYTVVKNIGKAAKGDVDTEVKV